MAKLALLVATGRILLAAFGRQSAGEATNQALPVIPAFAKGEATNEALPRTPVCVL